MARLYKCDFKKCDKQMGENEKMTIVVAHTRTTAELKELSKNFPNVPLELLGLKSMVFKKFDACKGCLDKFKKDFFEEDNQTKEKK